MSRVLLLLALWAPFVSSAGEVAFGVSFSDVQALSAAPADRVTAYGPAPSQRGELWTAGALEGADAPLVVLIHGGCWLDAYGVDHARALASALRDAGHTVLAPEYRRVGADGGGWPVSRDDLLQAIEQGTAGAKAARLVLVGHSAGGHLALAVAAALAEVGDERVVGVVGLAAIADPVAYAGGSGSCNTATPAFFGGMPGEAPEAYAAGDPLRAWAGPAARTPVVLLQGTADSIVPMSQAEALASAPAVELRRLDGAGHFDMIHPGTPAFGALLAAIEDLAGSAP